MKKLTVLAAALLLFSTACGKQSSAAPSADAGTAGAADPAPQPAQTSLPEPSADDIRLQELLNDNQGSVVQKRHTSLSFNRTISSMDNPVGSEYCFMDQDRVFRETSNHQGSYSTNNEYVLTIPDEPGTTGAVLANPLETYQEFLDSSKAGIDYVLLVSETVTGIEERDGHIYITTVTTDSAAKQEMFDAFSSYSNSDGGLQYQESLELRCSYDFAAENSDLVSIENYFVDADGNKVLDILDNYTYDADFAPDPENSVFADWINGNKPRKVTVTFNAGTDQAVTMEYMAPKNTLFSVYNNGDTPHEVYSDEACTQPVLKNDRESDLVIYVK